MPSDPFSLIAGTAAPPLFGRSSADPTVGNATSMMPNFGLSAEEIEAITAYLGSLRR